jgi:hypothetical protein
VQPASTATAPSSGHTVPRRRLVGGAPIMYSAYGCVAIDSAALISSSSEP